MKNQSLIIIICVVIFFVISSSLLAFSEIKQSNYSNTKKLWFIYFNDPKSEDLSFTIENYSTNPSVHWEVFADKTLIATGNENIKTNEKRSISLTFPQISSKEIVIKATIGSETKEIYKFL